MSAIAPSRRYEADRETVRRAHLQFGLTMAYAYSKENPTIPVLRILDPMETGASSFSYMSEATFDTWWDLLESTDLRQVEVHSVPLEEPHLRVVGDSTNPRRFGVAYTAAGRSAARDRRSWDRMGR